jgi:hypothetical protein
MNKKLSPGKVYGLLSFINVIVLLYCTLFISVFFPNIELEIIIIVDKISFGVFSLTWTYVFGSGAIKKFKGGQNDLSSKN